MVLVPGGHPVSVRRRKEVEGLRGRELAMEKFEVVQVPFRLGVFSPPHKPRSQGDGLVGSEKPEVRRRLLPSPVYPHVSAEQVPRPCEAKLTACDVAVAKAHDVCVVPGPVVVSEPATVLGAIDSESCPDDLFPAHGMEKKAPTVRQRSGIHLEVHLGIEVARDELVELNHLVG